MMGAPARLPVVDPVVALAARVAVLEARVDKLRRVTGPRDDLDINVLHAIHDAAGALPWRCSDVLDRAASVPGLRAALRAADVTSARRLGKLCARLAGHEIDGLVLSRVSVHGRPHWLVSSVSHRA